MEKEDKMKAKDIGANAGRVWRLLEDHGAATRGALSRELELKPAEIERAIGWLAREDKLYFSEDRRGVTRISLDEE